MPRIFDDIPRPSANPRRMAPRDQSIAKSLRIILASRKTRSSSRRAATRVRGQRVIVKARYVLARRGDSAASAHLAYIVREGAGRDGTTPVPYGEAIDKMVPGRGEIQYRFILSPESQSADLKELVACAVALMEEHTGQKLVWVAAEHYNTEHQHAHLVVRGVDRQGKKIAFGRDFVRREMRFKLGRYLTRQLGPRESIPIERELEASARTARPSKLDEIIKRASREGCLSHAMIPLLPALYRGPVCARLAYLESLGLAHNITKRGYELAPRWLDTLRAAARFDSYLTCARSLKYTAPALYSVYSSKQGPVTGLVTSIANISESDDKATAIVVECEAGAYYVPLLRAARGLKPGSVVTIVPAAEREGSANAAIGPKDERAEVQNGAIKKERVSDLSRVSARILPVVDEKEMALIIDKVCKKSRRGDRE